MALQLNDEQLASFEALTGIDPGQLNDVTVAYLKSVSGSDSNDPQDLWYATLTGLGYSGAVQDMQVAYWTDILGHGGQWNDLYYEWLVTTGGAFGPNVAIVLSSGGSCDYQPPTTTDCTAIGTYTANDTGFTNPADTWLWTIEPPVVGVDLTDATLKTCTVTTPTSDTDLTFNLKVVATDSVSTDTANRTTEFTQDHDDTNVAPVYIGPNITQQFIAQGIPINPIETFLLFTGTNLAFSLEGAWPAALVIDAGTGQITGTATDPITDYPNLTVRATNSKGFADTDPFTVTVTAGAIAPVFAGPVPAQVWQEGVVIAQFPMATYFTGTLPITYTIESGAFPVGITMNSAGQINGTPTVDGTGSVQIRGTNGSGFDVTNVWGWTIWEAIVSSTIPAQSTQVNAPYSHDFSQYFTGTVSTYGINAGSWPAGLTIDANTGIVTGTPTSLFAGSGSRVHANSLYEPTVLSGSFLFDVVSSLIYYVSDTDGDDNDSGLTEALAWKTVAKVNATTLFAGDTVLFNRGDTWREQLLPTNSGSSGSPITFGAYGTGDKPKILGSIEKNDTGDWTDETGNIWYASSVNVIKRLIMDSESVVSTQVATKVELTAQGDAWWDDPNNRIYLYSVGNPATFYNGVIECAEFNFIIWIERESYVTMENFDCRYSGKGGINAKDSAATNSNVIVDNCTIKFIGSNIQENDLGAVGIYITDITNYTITNNIIDQGNRGIVVGGPFRGSMLGVIDSNTISNMILGEPGQNDGMTIGNGDHAGSVISNNDISGHTDDGIDMGGASNVLFTGNTIHDGTFHAGGPTTGIKLGVQAASDPNTGNQAIGNYIYNMPDQGILTNSASTAVIAYNVIYDCDRGIHINGLTATGQNDNNEVYNNVCYNCTSEAFLIGNGIDVANQINTTAHNNILSGGQDLVNGHSSITTGGYNNLINDASVSNVGNGIYNGAADDLYATDPLFTDPINDDFTLTGSSPCIDEGLFVGLTEDIIGTPVPQGSAPDMGAYEFVAPDIPVPAFYALTPDDTTFEMLGVKIGTGGLTTTHTADLYAADYQGVYQKFPANTPVWTGGRVVLSGGLGSDVVSVFADTGDDLYGFDFVLEIDTTGAAETFTITCEDFDTFNASIDWGDGTAVSTITTWNDADLAHEYADAGDHIIRISGSFPNIRFSGTDDRLRVKRVLNIGDTGLTRLTSAFNAASNLTSVASTSIDTSGITRVDSAFQGCTSMTSCDVSKWDTSAMTNIGSLFNNCTSLVGLDVSGWDTSNITIMNTVFRNCDLLTDIRIDLWNIGAVTSITNFMELHTGLTTARYDATLIAWDAQTVNAGLTPNFGGSTYTSPGPAADAKANLEGAPDLWVIIDGGIA